MNRRQYLASLGIAALSSVSGCAVRAPGVPPDEAYRQITLEETDTLPEEYDFEIAADLVEPYVTPEHTAAVEVTAFNTGAFCKATFGDLTHPSDCFWNPGGKSLPEGLRLVAKERDRNPQDGEEWSADPQFCSLATITGQRLADGESVSNVLQIWSDGAAYFEPGAYRFDRRVQVTRDPDHHRFRWGMTVRVYEV